MGKHGAHVKRKTRDRRDVLLIVFALIAILATLVAIWAVATRNKDLPTSRSYETSVAPAETPKPLSNQIALPQFAWIYLAADTTEQTQTFQNPAQNFAVFRVSIVLDGETLWESELLKPGETSAPLVLSRPLGAGEYEAHLVYTCFSDEEALKPLNGADSPIVLKVK